MALVCRQAIGRQSTGSQSSRMMRNLAGPSLPLFESLKQLLSTTLGHRGSDEVLVHSVPVLTKEYGIGCISIPLHPLLHGERRKEQRDQILACTS